MSEEGLEVPEEHRAAGTLGQWVAIFTAILAAAGAVVGYQGGHLMNEVLLKKNEAVLRKTEAANEWNHYQSVSTKAHLAELAEQLIPPERAAQLEEKTQKYAAQREELMAKARNLDDAAQRADREADELNRPHARFALAMILLQIAISLASITALTQRTWLFAVAIVSAAGGFGLCLSAVVAGG